MRGFVAGVAIWGPGLEGWAASQPVLAGAEPYIAQAARLPMPTILSANERRRTGAAVRLALTVAEQAVAMAGMAPDKLRSVFASGNGDGAVVHAILETLASDDRQVSPTQFHNSVHNAAAGYWTIATGSHEAATCLGCLDATYPAALLKAMAELTVERQPVLLCVYDAPLPEPLAAMRAMMLPFAFALVLTPEPTATCLAALDVTHAAAAATGTAPLQQTLHALCGANQAAQALRLLESLARGNADRFSVGYLDGRLEVGVQPCSTAR